MEAESKVCTFNTNVLIKTLHVLLRNFPLLVSPFLKLKLTKKLPFVHGNNPTVLQFLLRGVVFLSCDKLKAIIYELCLDTMVGTAHTTRVKVLSEIYELLRHELDSPSCLQTPQSIHTVCTYSALHCYLLSHREMVRLSIKEEPNFFHLYQSFVVGLDPKRYYQQEALYPFFLDPLTLLFQYAQAFSTLKPAATS